VSHSLILVVRFWLLVVVVGNVLWYQMSQVLCSCMQLVGLCALICFVAALLLLLLVLVVVVCSLLAASWMCHIHCFASGSLSSKCCCGGPLLMCCLYVPQQPPSFVAFLVVVPTCFFRWFRVCAVLGGLVWCGCAHIRV
jgi:hypothetical protein